MRQLGAAPSHPRSSSPTSSPTSPSSTRPTRLQIFELTCLLLKNIHKQHNYKTNKYAHLLTDVSHLHITVTALKIISTGHISKRNHTNLGALHEFCKPGIKLSNFKKNISGLSIYSSYHIWLCRNDPIFEEPPFLPPPFPDHV